MATYSIADVERLTGIQAHTLRIWERRYGLIKPQRTETKIRFYSDSQLKLLLNVSVLLNHGYRISAVDKMPIAQINEVTRKILSENGDDVDKDIKALTTSMLTMNENLFSRVYQNFVDKHGLEKTVLELLYPFLNHVGVLWGTNGLMPAQEHFVSNLIRLKLFKAIGGLPSPKESASKMILFLPEGDYHEIGLLLSYYLAREAGYKTYYLGVNVPAEDVIITDDMIGADFVMSIIILPKPDHMNQLKRICSESSASVLISGNVKSFDNLNLGFTTFPTPDAFVKFLKGNLIVKHSV